MRPRLQSILLCLVGLGFFSARLPAQTPTLYWDINGPTAGSGGSTPAGIWDIGTNSWSSSSAGSATTTVWNTGYTAIFAAGTDATGAYTVTVSGTQTIGGMTFEEGTPLITGGILSFTTTSSFNLANTATIASALTGTGGLLEKIGSGSLTLSGANTYTGGTSVIAGTLNVTGSVSHTASDTLVNSTVSPVLNITGGGDLSTDRLRIGITGSTYSGTVLVDGIGSTVTNTTYLYVGEAGTGDLTISNGGSVTAPTTSIGSAIGGSGDVLVSGTGSALTNTATLYVGRDGLGDLAITNGGLVSNLTANIGYNTGGGGSTVYMDTGGIWNTTGTLTVGYASSGYLDVYGASTVTALDSIVGVTNDIYARINLSGSGSTFTTTNNLTIGGTGDGELNILNGADAITGGQTTIGNDSGSISKATLSGSGSTWTITSGLTIGNNGSGALYLYSNSLLSVGAGTGTVTLGASSGTGSLYFGNYNVEGGSDAGILNAASITTGSGTGKVYFESYSSTRSAPFYFTKDGTSGGGAVTIAGPTQVQNTFGYTILTGANTYTGGTMITGGTLVAGATGALGTGAITVNGGSLLIGSGAVLSNAVSFGSGGTLGGSGTFGSAFTVGTGISLAPGNSPGTLSFSNGLTLASGGTLDFEVQAATGAAGTGYDLLSISGAALDITATSGSPFTLKIISLNISGTAGAVSDFSSSNSYAWTIATSAAGLTGFSADKFVISTANFSNSLGIGSFFVTQSGNNLVLNFTPVPEPSTYALMLAGLGLAGLGIWRKRRI